MAKFCELCAKQTVAGRRIQHHHSIQWRFRAPRTTRQFKPNVRKVKMDVDGKVRDVSICMKCYKKMRKDLAELEENK